MEHIKVMELFRKQLCNTEAHSYENTFDAGLLLATGQGERKEAYAGKALN